MAAGGSRKVSAASARSHTRRAKQGGSKLPSGFLKTILAVSFVGILEWSYQVIQPPPPNILGSSGGLQITAPRIRLRDGRHLAYKEQGVPKDVAKYRIVFVHAFDSCRHDNTIISSTSKEIIDELGVYTVSFDRPGYGESDPDPQRTPKSICLDIEELANHLGLGSRFYVIGFSMGGEVIWGCLKYIPHRLAGAALLAPVVNYWWPSFPSNLSTEAYYQQLPRDQWSLRVAHYIPWLTYWWNTQKWFPSSSAITHNIDVLSPTDLIAASNSSPRGDYVGTVRHQGDYESIHRDMMIGFGSWEFDPMDLEDPFPNNEGSVHLWHGSDDMLVPVSLQRFIAQRLPWVRYHELTETGHLFPLVEGMGDVILKELLAGESSAMVT